MRWVDWTLILDKTMNEVLGNSVGEGDVALL